MKKFKVVLIYVAIILAVILILDGIAGFGGKTIKVEYQELLTAIEEDKVGKIIYQEEEIEGWFVSTTFDSNGKPVYEKSPDFTCTVPSYEQFAGDVAGIIAAKNGKEKDSITTKDYTFEYVFEQPEGESWLLYVLPYVFMIAAFIIVMLMISRAQSANSSSMNFGKSRARLASDSKITFSDVEGADEEKEELAEVVDFLKNPGKYTEMGARIPKGILLVGPPGTGKTLLARAVAGEAKIPFFSISGSDFVEMFVGVGASRVRDLFNTAKKSGSAIIFIDEIDAVGRKRGAGLGGGHDEREQTLNQLLVEMDGFDSNSGIIVMAATNRPDVLDPAIMRPGRFDRQIVVHMPDVKGREAILRLHGKKKKFASDVSMEDIAKSTPGFSGADLENLLNEAAILATRQGEKCITRAIIDEATDRTLMGPEKKSRKMSEKDKKNTAFHESGHAIAAIELTHCDPVREVSIIPRGMAAGYTMTMPGDEYSDNTRGKMLDTIAMSLGGRAAEEIAMDDITAGAVGDLKHATELARKMVIEYGMNDTIGHIYLGGDEEVFLGASLGHQKTFSDAFGARVDEEIKNILEEQYKRVKQLLIDHREGLDRVSYALMEKERMTGKEFEAIYKGTPYEAENNEGGSEE